MTDQRTMLHNAYSIGRHEDILLEGACHMIITSFVQLDDSRPSKPMFGNIIQCHSNCKGVPIKTKAVSM